MSQVVSPAAAASAGDAGNVRFPDKFNLAHYFLYDRLEEGLCDKVALRFGDRGYTYREVAERSLAIARVMIAQGLSPEERVSIVLPDLPPFCWSIFATLTAGGILTMGNPASPAEDLAYMLEYVKARVLVTTPAVAAAVLAACAAEAAGTARLPQLRTILLCPDAATGDDPEASLDEALALEGLQTLPPGVSILPLTDAIFAGAALTTPLPITHRDDPAIWLFTSGSTGRPKAAMHTHRDFAYNTEVYAKRTVGYRRDDVTVSVPRLFFGYATGTNLWFPFAVGATVGLFSERPTAESVAAAIARYRPTIVTNVPTMLGKLLDCDEERRAAGSSPLDLSSVRFHLSAGEALPEALLRRFLERFGGEVYDGIGSAEMFHVYITNRPGDVKEGSLGRIVEGYTHRLIDDDGNTVAEGEIGTLVIQGPSAGAGYWRMRDKSRETFWGDAVKGGDKFLRDADGYFWYCGRGDDMLKCSGVYVSPVEVENCLIGHPAVREAGVVGWRDETGLEKAMAFVELADGHEGSESLAAELLEWARGHIAAFKAPRRIVFATLPRTETGKIKRNELRKLANEGASA